MATSVENGPVAPDSDLMAAVDWPKLSAALPQMWEGQVDLAWLLSWYSNAQQIIEAHVRDGRADSTHGAAVRDRIDSALGQVPGLQMVHHDAPPQPRTTPMPVGGRDHVPLEHADPALHEQLQGFIRESEAATRGWAGRPAILLTLAREEGSDYLVLAVQDYSLGVRLPSPALLSEFELRHVVSQAVAAAIERGGV